MPNLISGGEAILKTAKKLENFALANELEQKLQILKKYS
ncbi:Uncharacterised protein [Orientia tsutsugamushi]|uniref:Uncharacterized protein n=2 Tax=Orientia tsutsugamushi TaxID=784 RepID=A0A2R8EZY0_ORITS|nr:Uncharacterised protein [Orientia tsutsugamushi]